MSPERSVLVRTRGPGDQNLQALLALLLSLRTLSTVPATLGVRGPILCREQPSVPSCLATSRWPLRTSVASLLTDTQPRSEAIRWERPLILVVKNPSEAQRKRSSTNILCGSIHTGPTASVFLQPHPACRPPRPRQEPARADSHIHLGWDPVTAGCRGRQCHSQGCSARSNRKLPGGLRRRVAAGCRPGKG